MPPAIKPGFGNNQIQTISVNSPPAAPYVLTAVVKLAPRANPNFGVRKTIGDTTQWFPTDAELIEQSDGVDTWEVSCVVDSGVATSFALDDLTEPLPITITQQQLDEHGTPGNSTVETLVNPDALELLNSYGKIRLSVFDRSTNALYTVPLTGIYNSSQKMWQARRQGSGWHRNARAIKTFYAFLPVRKGGDFGYLHIFATIMANTPEIQFDLNWTSLACEERVTDPLAPISYDGVTFEIPPIGDINGDHTTPLLPIGVARCKDILFTRALITIDPTIPAADGFAGAWVATSQFASGVGPAATGGDPAMNHATAALVKQVSTANPADINKLHVIPITFERPFSFAVAPSSVTPYLKRVVGVQDWSAALGGWANCKGLGLPAAADLPAMDLSDAATACKAAFAANQPWSVESGGSPGLVGLVPVSPMWPGAYGAYGGETSGVGMWPHYGAKAAMTGQKAALDVLLIEMIRMRCRTPGAMYYNISGFPVPPSDFAANGQSAPWRRSNRVFEKAQGSVQDLPFLVTRGGARRMNQAAYNPGPRGITQGIGSTGVVDYQNDPTPNVPDWYVTQTAGTVLQGTALPYALTIVPTHGLPPPITTNFPDQTAPILFQVTGAGAFNATKSVTIEVTGTGDLDIPIVENIVLLGSSAASTPGVQSKTSVAYFKTVTQIRVTAIVGTLLSTELFSIGRAPIGIADYNGFDGIGAIDDQHWVRFQAVSRSLFELTNHPLAKLYLMADAMSSIMTAWHGPGAAHRLDLFSNGAPGRGSSWTREFSWFMDAVTTAAAIHCAQTSIGTSRLLFDAWITQARLHLVNTFIPDCNLFQMTPGGKEFKRLPYGSRSDESQGRTVFWGCSSREQAYLAHGAFMLANVKWLANADRAELKEKVRLNAKGFRNLLWSIANGTKTGPHTYFPMALHYDRNGVLRYSDQGIDPLGTFDFFATQAEVPVVNPVSGVVLRGAVYPTVDDDRFVASIAANTIVENTPLTILNGGVSNTGQPVPVEIKVVETSGTGFREGIFDIIGTAPAEQGGGVVTSPVRVQWNENGTYVFRNWPQSHDIVGGQHFATITDIRLRTGTKVGSWNAGCSIVMGIGRVGLQFNNSNTIQPQYVEAYQIPYALAVYKALGDAAGDSADADECIKRFCGDGSTPAADLATAKATMETWQEYTGGPVGRGEQWYPLLHALRDA